MEAIPLEIWAQVLNFLDINSKLKLRCTCTHLFEIVDHRDFVIYFARSKQLTAMVKVFSRYNKPIGLTFKKTKKLDTKAINYLSKLTNLINLTFDNHEPLQKKGGALSGLGRLTNLRSLNLPKVFINDNILYSMANITHICIQETNNFKAFEGKSNLVSLDLGILEDFSLISKLENLRSLKIEKFTGANNQVKDLECATNLQSLFLSAFPKNPSPLPYPIRPPLDTLTSLHSLQLQNFCDVELGNCTNLTKLVLKNACPTKNDTRKWTSLTNLKSLHLSMPKHWSTARDVNKDEFQFITALSNLRDYNSNLPDGYVNLDFLRSDHLTSLKIDIKEADSDHELYRLTRLINLEKLLIHDDAVINYNFMTSFMKLTQLEIHSILTDEARESLTCVQHLTMLKIFKVIYDGPMNYATVQFNFSDLRQLEELHVPFITHRAFESLRGLTKVTSLTISHGAQVIPEILEKMPLKVLHFRRSVFEHNSPPLVEWDWSVIINLTALESLDVLISSRNLMKEVETRIPSLTALQHLTALQVPDDYQINIECFRYLTNLQKLHHHGGSKTLYKQLPFLYDYTTWKKQKNNMYKIVNIY